MKAEEKELEKWIKKEYRETHPETLVKITFPEDVMKIIASDQHKSKDGGFQICYDFWENKWYISHKGYIREVQVEGKTFLEAAQKYICAIRRENAGVLYRGIEAEVNKHLPKDCSIEIDGNSITLYRYSEGDDQVEMIVFRNCKGKSVEEIVSMVNEILEENIK